MLISVVIKHVANFTKIGSEFNTTAFTVLLWFLNTMTNHTSNFSHCMSVHFVAFLWVPFAVIFYFIVADSACEKFFAIRTPFLAFSLVMSAAIHLLLLCVLILIFFILRWFLLVFFLRIGRLVLLRFHLVCVLGL